MKTLTSPALLSRPLPPNHTGRGGRKTKKTFLFNWIVLPFLAGVLLRLWNLPDQILGGDEVHAVRAAFNHSLPEILVTYQVTDNCIPLTALDKLWMIAGLPVTEMVLRLPVLLCGFAALLALPAAFAGRTSRGTELIYRWLLAISPALVLYSRIARSYMSYAFAGVHGIKIENGRWSGGADPQRDGMALEV